MTLETEIQPQAPLEQRAPKKSGPKSPGTPSKSNNRSRVNYNRSNSQSKGDKSPVKDGQTRNNSETNGKQQGDVVSPRRNTGRNRSQSVNSNKNVTQSQRKQPVQSAQPQSERVVVVKRSDMPDEMLNHAIQLALTGLKQHTVERNVATNIKREFDRKYRPTWHCIVGQNFGSFVTHESRHFAFFYVDDNAVLLFRTAEF